MRGVEANSKESTFFDILGMLRRRKFAIAIPILVGAAVGAALTRNEVATYQANVMLMIATRKVEIININSVMSHLPQDNLVLRSELDLISSRLLAGRIVDRLDLTHDPHLLKALGDSAAWAKPLAELSTILVATFPAAGHLVATALPASEPNPAPAVPTRDEAIEHVLSNLRVSNDGRSYTIVVSFTSPDPRFAARIANAVAEQYLVLQTEMKSEATLQANTWLSSRLNELRQALEASEQAVEDYRQKEGLFESGGEPLDAGRLAALTQQRDEVRLHRVEAEARLASVRTLIDRGPITDSVRLTAESEILRGLRQQENDLRRRIAVLASSANDRHPAMIALNSELAVVRQRASEEAARIVDSLSNEIAVARSQEAALEELLSGMTARQWKINNATLGLRQLVREAEANRGIYEVVLNRYKEIAEQVDLQRPDANIISPAAVPTEPAPSRRLPIIAIGGIGGALFGVLLALLFERLSRPVRSVPELERATGITVIGLVPNIGHGWPRRPEDRIGRASGAVLRDSMRAAQIAIGPDAIDRFRSIVPRPQVLLVTSALAHEGKTTFCLSMARMLAADGKRVMLIDADLRKTHHRSDLRTRGGGDLIDLLDGRRPLEDVVLADAKTGLHHLAARSRPENPQAVLSGAAFQQLIQACSRAYDAIIIDTPPVMVAPDAVVVAPLADACVFIARWGHTPMESVLAGLRLLHVCKVKVSGIVLNRVRETRFSSYAPYSGQDIYPPAYPVASQLGR